MVRVIVLALPDAMVSSLAITVDALTTANALCRHAGRPEPFEVQTLKVTRTTVCKFRSGDIVIVPGLGSTTDPDPLARLANPAVRRA
ncbi:MAG: AraC family transcriptional regulator, partial [Tardiphaga sp.]|nr:AraC family transcriptional regulator [Tardiphaga sp.]